MVDPYAPYADLCQRIRDHCAAQSWYGPDGWMEWPESMSEKQVWYYADGTSIEVSTGSPIGRFKYPPATEEQILETEEHLGSALPPALRAIYATVADGGFGPGYGLFGVRAVAQGDAIVSKQLRTTVAAGKSGSWRLSAEVAHTLEQNPQGHLEYDDLPADLVTLCDWGCGIASVFDLGTGRVYGIVASPRPDWNGTDTGIDTVVWLLDFQARSIEDWFDRWLLGTLRSPFAYASTRDREAEFDAPEITSPFEDPDFLEWYESRGFE